MKTNTKNDITVLTNFYKQQNKLRINYPLAPAELFTINHNIINITDSIKYYNGNFYKIEKIYSSKKINLCYPLINIKVIKIDLSQDYKNSNNKFNQFYYNNDILPKLKQYNLDSIC